MIDREHKLSTTRQVTLLEISRGTVYYLPQPVSQADLALMRKIDKLHLEYPFMGSRMLRDQLARQGIRGRPLVRLSPLSHLVIASKITHPSRRQLFLTCGAHLVVPAGNHGWFGRPIELLRLYAITGAKLA